MNRRVDLEEVLMAEFEELKSMTPNVASQLRVEEV